MEFRIGNEAIASYKRLDYSPWHAIAEFIDNSTQAYANNKSLLDKIFKKEGHRLEVRVIYDGGLLRISDNSIGMDEEELERALTVGKTPKNAQGRSRYGMGLKTASCWFGDKWTIKTKKHGETVEHIVDIDVLELIKGKQGVKHQKIAKKPEDHHYTIIEVRDLHRTMKTRTTGKVKQYLQSIYRQDLRAKTMDLYWNDDKLEWKEIDENIFVDNTGHTWKKDFSFQVNGKKVEGWVGLLRKGSRAEAGFSILHSGRVVKGWPDSWRPTSIYGQDQGSNDLINQRVVGEIYLDAFEVTHTKDNILWEGEDEDIILEKLKEKCADYTTKARLHRKNESTPTDSRGASDKSIQLAAEDFRAEITSSEMIDALRLEPIQPEKVIKELKLKILNQIEPSIPLFEARVDNLTVKLYLEDLSPLDWYVTTDAAREDEVVVNVNKSHPHFIEYCTEAEVLNYLRHCVYDALAEWKARRKASRIDPDTIKTIKDGFLRIPLIIEEHLQDEERENDSK